ncbi:hypothetical protein J6G99_05740 [bacterium]|nr:hypothetical protein [bacterium]
MKKIITILLIGIMSISIVSSAEQNKFSKAFIKNFKVCENYSESLTSDFEGSSFSIKRNILGWSNGQCRYQETISSSRGKYQLDCYFNEIITDELYSAMKDKSKEQEIQNIDIFEEKVNRAGEKNYVKTGSTSVKGSKAYVTWAKFLNNPYFCVPKKID